MSKVIDYDKIVRDSFLKAQRDLGLRKEPVKEILLKEEEETQILDLLDNVNIKSGEWGTKGTVSYEELSLFSKNIREIAGASASVEDFNKIIAKLNEILGYEEKKFGPQGLGFAIESGKGATNARELTTILYFASMVHSIIMKQTSSSVSGGFWEGFMANLLGGSLAYKAKVSPIQDIYDGAGNYVSLKAVGQSAKLTGSKMNLAIAIANTGKVYYVVAIRGESDNPFRIAFRKFLLTKENYFQFITNTINPFEEGKALKATLANIDVIKGKIRPQQTTNESFNKLSEAKQTVETSLDAFYIEKAKKDSGVESGPAFLKAIETTKENFRKQVKDLISATPNALKKFKIIFKDNLIGDNELNFPPSKINISLEDENKFVNTMFAAFIFGKEDRVFKEGAYNAIASLINSVKTFERPDVLKNPSKVLEQIKKYDINKSSGELQIIDIKEIDDRLENENKSLIEQITQKNSNLGDLLKTNSAKEDNKFAFIFQEVYKLYPPDAPAQQGLDILNLVRLSYNNRMKFYEDKHKLFIDSLEQLISPFLSWYKDLENKKAEISTSARKLDIQASTSNFPTNADAARKIEDFWTSLKGAPLESSTFSGEEDEEELEAPKQALGESKGGKSATDSQFGITLGKLEEIIEVDDTIPDFIVSKLDLQRVAQSNASILKSFIEPYYEAFKKITLGTREYFVADDPNGMAKVNEGISNIQEIQKEKLTSKETGKIKKASELKEVLNMTREAAIVLEMLQRMED